MKKFFIPLVIFLLFFEGISIIFTKFELFIFNEEPKYSFEEGIYEFGNRLKENLQ